MQRITLIVIAVIFLFGTAGCKTTSEFTVKTKTINPNPEVGLTITFEKVLK